jgi:hypothetical protein
MARKPKPRKGEPTQTTETGLEIPLPTRRDFMGNLHKLARRSDADKPRPKKGTPQPPADPSADGKDSPSQQ